ncbi:hypothetical protein LTR78_004131 [Recurvomyces mirabilis]|uniref:Uncharacterized protein n=1 Tax=Recurvomyces mirabilis TaxID=574656 RepID=A0AAE0WQH2_9PEZI|nr:hypothetical protein LTR78_004131 [Recurvomyces mirabilis]KAK5153698.1 hypothetical protein LTS14_007392 [Recurvomyces mirabilis]
MGRGGVIYLSYTALILLSRAPSSAGAADLCAFCNLWTVDIDESPAPSPEDGPPFSAHAIRNKALLPYEIIGIVGAYIVTVLILGTFLLTVGRSLRRRAHDMAARPTEMVKPMGKAFDPSPISPNSARGWLRKKKSATSSIRSGQSNVRSPGLDSVVSFDNGVVEADRQRRQDEMERLYAAVMAHDERKSQQPAVTISTDDSMAAPPEYSQRKPPRLVTDDPRLRHLQTSELSPRSPGTPKSPIRAIYPPDSNVPPMPQSPTSPIKAGYPNMSTPLSPQFPILDQGDLRINRKSRSDSLGSRRTVTSDSGSSGGKRLRKTLRNIKISAPLHVDDNSDGARTPLSPRFYTDPGVPPEPPTARTTETMDSHAPTTPGTAQSWRYPDERDHEELDQVRDLPLAHPNRLSTYNYASEAQALTDVASTRPDPTGSIQERQAGAASNTARPLPFRQLQNQTQTQSQTQTQPLKSPQLQAYQQMYPLSPLNTHHSRLNIPYSAGPGQTQFVSPRRDHFGAPRTGMATPYSPYMPFTPLTPVTPHLASRAERKQRLREEGKARGVITEEDAVRDEGELWSSGY